MCNFAKVVANGEIMKKNLEKYLIIQMVKTEGVITAICNNIGIFEADSKEKAIGAFVLYFQTTRPDSVPLHQMECFSLSTFPIITVEP